MNKLRATIIALLLSTSAHAIIPAFFHPQDMRDMFWVTNNQGQFIGWDYDTFLFPDARRKVGDIYSLCWYAKPGMSVSVYVLEVSEDSIDKVMQGLLPNYRSVPAETLDWCLNTLGVE